LTATSITIPNLRHLRAFSEVARCRSISQASRKLYLSQPAITQAIARLEKSLDSRLFDRRSDGVFPTESGELFLHRVERAKEQLSAGARDVARLSGNKSGQRSPWEYMTTTTQLRALIAVSEARNFSLAARNIGISQPSLHRSARELEGLLDIPLFAKTSQGITLTRPARILAQSAKLAFSEVRQGIDEVGALRGIDAGRITLGSMPLARSYILPSAINDLSRTHPNARISVVDGPYDDLLHHLRHGDIDILIGALRHPAPTNDVIQEALFAPPLAIVARAKHPLAGANSIDTDDLCRFPWVVPRAGTPTRDHFEAIFSSVGAQLPASVIESSSLVLVRGLLQESDRLTIISAHQVLQEQKLGLLVSLPFDMSHTRRPIGLTMRKDWQPTRIQKTLLALLRDKGRNLLGQ
jgi:DNA-binding transcriptional LysR family regulator